MAQAVSHSPSPPRTDLRTSWNSSATAEETTAILLARAMRSLQYTQSIKASPAIWRRQGLWQFLNRRLMDSWRSRRSRSSHAIGVGALLSRLVMRAPALLDRFFFFT